MLYTLNLCSAVCQLCFKKTRKTFFFPFGCPRWHVKLSQPGLEPMPPTAEAWHLNHWTTGGVLDWEKI